jgi:hypothetical protein
MIQVNVEIWPGGFREARRTIAQMRIANVSDLAAVSDYRVLMTEDGTTPSGKPATKRAFDVRGHLRDDGVWALIAKALAVAREKGGAE